MKRLFDGLRNFFRPELVVLDIYGFERLTERFLICHGEEIAENFFAESPICTQLKTRRFDGD